MSKQAWRILDRRTKAETNRDNAQHSTGPKTAKGKAASSQNALSHGLTSSKIVLPHEDPAEYRRLQASLVATYSPASEYEAAMVETLAEALWRRQRAAAAETAFLSNRTDELMKKTPGLTPDAATALLFIDPVEMARMRLIMRYVAQAERACSKAMADLVKTQKARKFEAKKQALADSLTASWSCKAPAAAPASGFVSYPRPEHGAAAQPPTPASPVQAVPKTFAAHS
ncbi:MAG TPA: hypothetical protein VEQ63_00460 [Bryobacteraceae bacterium]|nr:hypothetical protein [Bryobacteraceae bacterium]